MVNNAEQKLNVNLSISIPDEYILITKVELEELKSEQLLGFYWTMKDLEKRMNKKSQWIQKNLLYPPRFKKILDSQNGGFVYYPKASGQAWCFQANKMAQFLDDNFYKIFN